jgi:hypothetical protein
VDQVVTVGERVVPFAGYGPRGGHRVVFHYGTPGTRLVGPRMTRVVDLLDVDLVVLDRPGYGPSTPWPGRCVADVVSDVVSVADGVAGTVSRCGEVLAAVLTPWPVPPFWPTGSSGVPAWSAQHRMELRVLTGSAECLRAMSRSSRWPWRATTPIARWLSAWPGRRSRR